MSRLPFLAVAALLIAMGLTLRLVPWGLPLAIHHYAGGMLWGAMVFTLAAAVRPRTWGRVETIVAALLVAALVECVRLDHSPLLDAFRVTLAGQLLLGRIFSAWNVFVYALGIACAAGATWRLHWKAPQDLGVSHSALVVSSASVPAPRSSVINERQI